MQINSTEHSNDLVEHRFTVGDIPGILRIPASATPTRPAPLLLAGQPGALPGMPGQEHRRHRPDRKAEPFQREDRGAAADSAP